MRLTEVSMFDGDAHPRVGVGVLIIDQNRVLLSLRRRPPEAGCWSILGGRVELFETIESCVIREAREEAGIDVVVDSLLCVTDHIVGAEKVHWVSPAYLGRIVGGVPENREPDKAAQVAWFSLGELPEPMTLTAHRAIAAYLTSLSPARSTASRPTPHGDMR